MNNYTIYKMTNQVKSLGKTLLDNSGITEWLGGKINIKDKSIPVYIDKTDWNNFKAKLDALEKDPVQVDLYLKAHGLEQVEGLKDYILNNDIKQNSVNELITQQNYTNIAKQASGFKGVNTAIEEYNKLTVAASRSELAETISTTNTSLGKYLTGLNKINCLNINSKDIIKMKSDIILTDKNGNIIKVITSKPEYLKDSLL